jgi:hypothetical protein
LNGPDRWARETAASLQVLQREGVQDAIRTDMRRARMPVCIYER